MARSQQSAQAGTRLTPAQEAFCLEYLANGLNASKAYKATHMRCRSDGTARVEGHRLLTYPNIRQFLEEERRARNERLRMDADEAMALIGLAARADIADAFDVSGSLLPVHQWPYELRMAVKEVKPDGTVKLVDPLRARELVAQAAGRLRSKVDVTASFDHAAFLEALTPLA